MFSASGLEISENVSEKEIGSNEFKPDDETQPEDAVTEDEAKEEEDTQKDEDEETEKKTEKPDDEAEGEGEETEGEIKVAAKPQAKGGRPRKLTNQFNFSERAALTYNNPTRVRKLLKN